MLDVLLNWVLRGLLLALGAGAAVVLRRRLTAARREGERWPFRLALAMVLLAAVYAAGHAKLLLDREEIEAGREAYARYGDTRRVEDLRAQVRGWVLDCTGDDGRALARYGLRDGRVERVHPLGEAGANLIGGGDAAGERDYVVERLFDDHLRKPRSLGEVGEIHPAGTDLRLTLCEEPTREAGRLLRESGRAGAVLVQDVRTGALVAYAATGGPQDPPLGIQRYALPGSVWKLALAALWWESGMPAEPTLPCPPRIRPTPRSRAISNYGGVGYGTVEGPTGMLRVSCNTAAITMALRMRERLGREAFADAYRRFGFVPYDDEAPGGFDRTFWNTGSDAWAERMSPPPSRIRLREPWDPFEWSLLAIGQGPVDVTPLAVSRFVQAIGNDGVMLPPTLEWDRLDDVPEGRRVMQASTAERLRAAMLEVVDEGTGRAAAPPLRGTGWDLGGKTGTAEVQGRPDDGWFAGLVLDPGGRPRYTVVVYLVEGGPGGRGPATAAGGMAGFLARWAGEEGEG